MPTHVSLDTDDVPAVLAWLRGLADDDRYDPDADPDRVARAEGLVALLRLWEPHLRRHSSAGELARMSLALEVRRHRHRPGFQERWE